MRPDDLKYTRIHIQPPWTLWYANHIAIKLIQEKSEREKKSLSVKVYVADGGGGRRKWCISSVHRANGGFCVLPRSCAFTISWERFARASTPQAQARRLTPGQAAWVPWGDHPLALWFHSKVLSKGSPPELRFPSSVNRSDSTYLKGLL